MSAGDDGGAGSPRLGGAAARLVAFLAAAIRYWALLGGLVTAALALMVAASALSNLFFGAPFSADYELTKHLIAVAIFMFLPYCQLAGANVTVDIFTERMGSSSKAAMSVFSSLFAIAFSLLLFRQMSLGFSSYLRYPEVTPVLRLPLWTAYPPILLSLLLLLAAAILTMLDGWRAMRGLPGLVRARGEPAVE